jgi:hypothetical protein
MNAADRIKYANVLSKIHRGKISQLTEDDYEWLKKNPNIISEIKMQKKKFDAMMINKHCKGTINEILHNLDLSDRLMR